MLANSYKTLFQNRTFVWSVVTGVLLIIAGGVFTSLAQKFTNVAPGSAVGDILLDAIPAFPYPDLIVYFVIWGSMLVAFSILIIALFNPKYLPASLKTVGLLYIIRAAFISMTHLKVPPEKATVAAQNSFVDLIYNSNDLFFSGHVALPLVAAFIFWQVKSIRIYLLIAAVVMAVGVLWSKSHYSIDVFAAPFMAYGIVVISRWLFKKDFAYIHNF